MLRRINTIVPKRYFKYLSLRYCSNSSDNKNNKFTSQEINVIPLDKPVSWIPKPVYAKIKESEQVTKVTKLSNGLTVASEPKFGNFCTVGVLIDSGSRYEVAFPSGISHFLEKLAFGDTVSLKRLEIIEKIQNLGGIIDCQSSRDTLTYATSIESVNLEKAVEILGETVLRPRITNEEVNDARQAVSFDLESMQLRPEKDNILMELVHAAAYRDNTLGLPKICPPENIQKIDRNTLYTFMKHHHTPDRMVLAGVGIEHDRLVEIANKHFVEKLPIWLEDKSVSFKKSIQIDSSCAQYTGGIIQQEADLSDVSVGPNPLPELAHLVLGLESVGYKHPDFIACCVLCMMMGGGGSFSAGGPGKGMYTRLYTNVLNRYHWIHTATAFNFAYADTGLLYIYGSAHPTHLGDLTQVITKELVNMSGEIGTDELERAKVQLQSMVLMNLESRPVMFEDVGRQVLALGYRIQPKEYIDLIGKISKDDILRIASLMLKTKPSVGALGSLNRLPSLGDIEAGLLDRNGKLPTKSRFSIFSS